MTAITPLGLQETDQTETRRRGLAWHEERARQLAPKFCDKCGEPATFWIGGKRLAYLCATDAEGVTAKLWRIENQRGETMKVNVLKRCEIEIKYVRIQVAVRYGEEDIPSDFPLRDGDMWRGTVEVDTGRILEWPQGQIGELYMKVVDEGTYTLLDEEQNAVATLDGEYVPHCCVPGEYGDYIELIIDKGGVITNWPSSPSFESWNLDQE